MFRISFIQFSGHFVWSVRNGKGKIQNNNQIKGNPYMSKLWKKLVNLIYEIGDHSGCHQLPERSFFWKDHQFPVCARCTGVAIGQFLAIIFGTFVSIPIFISTLFLSVMGIDWGLQEIKIKESNNFRRLFTGILGGFGLFSIYIAILKKIKKKISRYYERS